VSGLAREGAETRPCYPGILGNVAYPLGYIGEDIDFAIELLDRALALNPSFAQGWYWSGWLRLWAGQPELGISHFETSLRLSLHTRRSPIFMSIGVGHFFARRFDDGEIMLLRSLQEHPGCGDPCFCTLAREVGFCGAQDAIAVCRRSWGSSPE
jgi:tetratricopeptide (TPR) repeat protein